MMKPLIPFLCVLALAACNTGERKVPATPALFVTDDCALISAIARARYDLSRDDPAMRLRLNGEDAQWRPGCDWQGMGFNLVPVSGPEGEAATAGMDEITFNRPRYDVDGALVRTSRTAGAGSAERVLCRVRRNDGGWSLDSCGPDPKEVLPPPAAPSPADATPDARIQPPANGQPAVRDATLPDANPGNTPGPDLP
jgi:hypothetical protein